MHFKSRQHRDKKETGARHPNATHPAAPPGSGLNKEFLYSEDEAARSRQTLRLRSELCFGTHAVALGRERGNGLCGAAAVVNQKLWNVASGRDDNTHMMRGALAFIELPQPLAQPVHLHPDDGVFAFFKIICLAENVEADRVLTNLVRFTHQGAAANVTEQFRPPGRLPKTRRGENAKEFLTYFGNRQLGKRR